MADRETAGGDVTIIQMIPASGWYFRLLRPNGTSPMGGTEPVAAWVLYETEEGRRIGGYTVRSCGGILEESPTAKKQFNIEYTYRPDMHRP